MPRNNADKRRAVKMLLDDEEWWNLSDPQIAEICKVSQPFVLSERQKHPKFQSEVITDINSKRRGKDGKMYPAKKARRKRTAPTLAQSQNGASCEKIVPTFGRGRKNFLSPPARRFEERSRY